MSHSPLDEVESSRAPLLDHLIELRQRLIIVIAALGAGFLACFFVSEWIFQVLLLPYRDAWASVHDTPVEATELTANFFSPLEMFFLRLKLALVGAIVLTFPVIAWQVYGFVAPGLYKNERGAFAPFLILSPVLFWSGMAFVYYFVLPMVMRFSLSQEQTYVGSGLSVELLLNVSDYFNLITTLMLVFGASFQMPVLMMLLSRAGLLKADTLLKGWRFAVVAVALFAAFATPPDPVSQILLGSALLLLYFISIGAMKLIEAGQAKRDAQAAEEEAGNSE